MARFVIVCVAALLSVLGGTAHAQPAQTGTVAGTAQDPSGAVLPGVTITVTSAERGVERTAVTDGQGRYVLPAMAIGPYDVVATLDGFAPARVDDALVESEKITDVTLTLQVGGVSDAVTVVGTAPIVDRTTPATNIRIRRQEFERLPVGRTYQALVGLTPGAVGTGNVNSLGALTDSNLFIIDSVDTTDPATGTNAASLNFEAIQEVSVSTSAVSAEYGRGQGAIVNVITKSGTNAFEGSARYVAVNDQWDAQNTQTNEVTGASLARVKFDKVNPAYAFTGGGPIVRNRAWFFGAYEHATNTTARRQTAGPVPEDYQQSTENNWLNAKATVQIASGHQAWVKYFRTPTDGFIFDYWGAFGSSAGELEALTAQRQTADAWSAQWNGVVRGNWTMEAAVGAYKSHIDVTTFAEGRTGSNAPVFSSADNRTYNGSPYDGFVDRPRQQANVASSWFFTLGSRSHNVKAGLDLQRVESGALFSYPNNQYFITDVFNQVTGAFTPQFRRDYQSGDSTSEGQTVAVYLRDKFDVTDRFFAEVGARLEKQTGRTDLGIDTVDTLSVAPRLAATFDVAGNGQTIVVGSYGRYYAGIVQTFSDGFAGIPQQANYDNYAWNGTAYVLQNQVRVSGSSFRPNLDLKPSYLDEVTLGVQRQFGRTMAAGVRFIARDWDDLIDDVRSFNPDGSVQREVQNYAPAERRYRGVQATYEKRFSDGWNATASYTYSRTEGNHFAQTFTQLGDFLDAQCRTTVDPTVGVNGVIPCAEVQDGANKFGRPIYDRPHNLKLTGAYVRPVGPVTVTVGGLAEAISKRRYEKVRPVNVLLPGTLTNAGPTGTYFYNERGADQLPGLEWYVDGSTEVTWRGPSRSEFGLRGEVFNLTNEQAKIISNNTAFCGTTATAACGTAVANYGKAGARGSFQTPRRFRISAVVRF